ncbi:hypothetical protein NHJ13734_006691 [Beauveria thailandica]
MTALRRAIKTGAPPTLEQNWHYQAGRRAWKDYQAQLERLKLYYKAQKKTKNTLPRASSKLQEPTRPTRKLEVAGELSMEDEEKRQRHGQATAKTNVRRRDDAAPAK